MLGEKIPTSLEMLGINVVEKIITKLKFTLYFHRIPFLFSLHKI